MKNMYLTFFLLATFSLISNSQPLNNNSFQQDFFLNDWTPKEIERPTEYNEISPPLGSVNVIVAVNFKDTITKVPKYVFGNNANVYSTIMWNNTTLVENIKNLNPHVLRYPGGNLSNNFFWDREKDVRFSDVPTDTKMWHGMNPDTWTMSVPNYYRFLEETGTTGIICVNYSYARYGLSNNPVTRAAHYAAEWVRYDNGRTKFWELGNENFGSWQAGYEINTATNRDGQLTYQQSMIIFMDLVVL